MALRFLLDEQISGTVAVEMGRHHPHIPIASVHSWQEGRFLGRQDRALLLAARTEAWTLVTYDQKTIPPLLIELEAEGEAHAGVVFVDDLTIANNEFGLLIRSLAAFYQQHETWDWRNRVAFLYRVTG